MGADEREEKRKMKNTLGDLNNYMFTMLERLDDPDMTPEKMELEKQRAQTMVKVGKMIVENANLALRAEEFKAEYAIDRRKKQMPVMLEIHDDKNN